MSDELTIQPQVQQKSNAVPYAAGGAIVGGLAGALSPVGVTKQKYASYEDILKESKDTFDSQIEKGGDAKGVWEAAKEHAEKVKNAEAEYDKKVQEIKDANKTVAGTLPETEQAAKDLKLAQENYDKALEAEKNKLANTSAKISEIKVADEMKAPERYANFNAFKKDYEPLQQAYAQAIVDSHSTSAYINASDKYSNMKTKLNDLYKDAEKKAGKLKTPLRGFEQKKNGGMFNSIRSWFGGNNTSIYNDILSEVQTNIHPTPAKLSNKEIKDLGDFIAETDRTKLGKMKKSLAKTEEIIEVFDKAGNLEGYVKAPRGTYDQAYEVVKNEAKAEQEKIAAELLGNAKERYILNQQRADFDKNFKVSAEQLKEANVASPIGLGSPANYEADLKELEKIKTQDYSRLTKKEKNLVDKYCAGSPKKAYNAVKARKNIATRYTTELKALDNKIANIVDNDSRLADLKKNIEKVETDDKGVRKAYGKLRKKFPEFFTEPSKLSDSEIATKAEEALKGKNVATKLESAKQVAEARAKELGLTAKELTDDELAKILKDKGIGTKEEFLAKTKNAAKEAIEKDLGKIRTPNKFVNGLIAGTALALVGLGIGSSMKKDQA